MCSYTVFPGGITYGVTWGSGSSGTYYDFELSSTYEPHFDAPAPAGRRRNNLAQGRMILSAPPNAE